MKERSVGSLFADLAREASRLIRQEIALAKAETLDGMGRLGIGAALIGAGALVSFAGVLVLLAAATIALALVLPPWAAALVVGGAVLLLGIVLLLVGRANLAARKLVPERTLRTLRDDAAWAKEQMR